MEGPTRSRTADVLVLCCDRAHVGDPDTAARVVDLLASRVGDLAVEPVPDLCSDLPSLLEHVRGTGAMKVVLGLCSPGPRPAELQVQGRRADLDPFAIEAIDLGLVSRLGPREGFAERASVALAAAAAAARAVGPTPSARMRLQLAGDGVSRRGLLSGAAVSYRPVAAIEQGRCSGTDRCGLCVAACPVDAIVPSRPFPSISTDRCIGCAACESACPTEAVGVAGATVDELIARLDTVQAWPWRLDRPALLFTCRGAARGLRRSDGDAEGSGDPHGIPGPGWLPVPVPCLASVTEGWLLQALAAGAPAVGVLGCGEACGAGSLPGVEERIEHGRAVLDALATTRSDALVRLARADAPAPLEPLVFPIPGRGRARPVPLMATEPSAIAVALGALVGDEPRGELDVPGGPLGQVSVAVDGCTLCGACTKSCPTAALLIQGEATSPALTLDDGRCVACGHCVEVCPERVVSVERRITWQTVAGRRTLKRGEAGRCHRCGQPVAPTAMLERIRELLPDASPDLLDVLTGLCTDCRGR